MVVNALVHSIPAIGNVLLVGLMFWFLFAIMGFNLFGGTFGRCVKNDNWTKWNLTIVPNKTLCNASLHEDIYADNFTWFEPNINFDDSLKGVLALFEMVRI